MARLSTHVLDISRGLPVESLAITLRRIGSGERSVVATGVTNREGRTDEPLLSGARIEPGIYELTFHAGDYFRRIGVVLTEPPFIDEVVVRLGVSDPMGHYHVPLLLSPYGYSVYRGS